MKARNWLLILSGILFIPLYLSSCGEDRWAAYAEQTQTDRWIDDTMRVWYYWHDEIPQTNKLNYFQAPFTFYASLLSQNDGKSGRAYSTIDSLSASTRSIPYTDYSYGFQFSLKRVTSGENSYLYAHILYVASDSPAADIELKRGEWIMAIDGEELTDENYVKLYGSTAMTLTVGYYDAEKEQIIAYEKTRDIASARTINDNPVYYKNIYQRADKRIGYLVYNHFSSGITDNSHEYNDDLRSASQYFASGNVNELILDLRYNNGGLLSCAELLCTLLAPANQLGQKLGFLEFNDRITPRETSFSLNPDLIQSGTNLNLSTLYILTSSQTASASEMLINCLKPYMKVVLIGSVTEGKNVGSISFINTELRIKMSPIVCKIYNSEGKSEYKDGFEPDLQVDENSDIKTFLPFGNPDELLLSKALEMIDGNAASAETTSSLKATVVSNSVQRRASRAVQINR